MAGEYIETHSFASGRTTDQGIRPSGKIREIQRKTLRQIIKRSLTLDGYRVEVNARDEKTVSSAWLRFPGLPHEIGISPHASQVLSIKVELDTRPPPGAGIKTSIVRRHATLNLCHYDKTSLLGGKLHAVLNRKWTKGRDLYDARKTRLGAKIQEIVKFSGKLAIAGI